MKVLYFAAHRMWPLTSGNRLRDYHLARHLAARASVTFVEMSKPGEPPISPPQDDAAFDCVVSLQRGADYSVGKILRGMIGPTPLTILNYSESRSASQLARVLARERFDVVQIEGVQLSEYVPVIRAAPSRPPILVDWHNIESELMWRYSENAPNWGKRQVARRTAGLLANVELQLLTGCEAHTVASEREREKLLARCPSAKVHVLPNGVNAGYFLQSKVGGARRWNGQPVASNRSLLFVGSMDYHANIDAVRWFTREIWPEIAQKYSDLEFIIVGRNPSREVRQLESGRVRVTGTVDDVRPYYASALAAVVPLRVGSGTRLKILEAMAAGVPVVSTRLGAEGINAAHDVHLLLADTPAEIAQAIDCLAQSLETRSRLAQAARELALRYDWAILGEKLYGIHSDLVRIS